MRVEQEPSLLNLHGEDTQKLVDSQGNLVMNILGHQQNNGKGGSKWASIKCFRCGGMGHMATNCKPKVVQNNANVVIASAIALLDLAHDAHACGVLDIACSSNVCGEPQIGPHVFLTRVTMGIPDCIFQGAHVYHWMCLYHQGVDLVHIPNSNVLWSFINRRAIFSFVVISFTTTPKDKS